MGLSWDEFGIGETRVRRKKIVEMFAGMLAMPKNLANLCSGVCPQFAEFCR